MIMRILLVLALVLGLGIAGARAHAFLDHANPAVGSRLTAAPAEVRLWFTTALEPAFSSLKVVDAAGHPVDLGDGKVDGADPSLLKATLKPLPSGTYKVIWRVVSVDTHVTEGDFNFRVGS